MFYPLQLGVAESMTSLFFGLIILIIWSIIMYYIIKTAVAAAFRKESLALLAVKLAEAKQNGISTTEIRKARVFIESLDKINYNTLEEKENKMNSLEEWWLSDSQKMPAI